MAQLLIDIVTGLPEIVRPVLAQSILKRATERGAVQMRVHDLRAFAPEPHRQIDDYPFGGGAGMVLKPEPIFDCLEQIERDAVDRGVPVDAIVYMTPDGERLDQAAANRMSMLRHIVILAGHYKGIDQRVRDTLVTREISIGDYVLSGGELPALVLVDAVVRLVPGVLGDATSALTDSFQDDLLSAPTYTRPAVYRNMEVPPVLRSGDHEAIASWRESERLKKTAERRPDLLQRPSSGLEAENTN